jgi:TnpA family transposase
MPRMDILTAPERGAFDAPPEFTGVERKVHFSFPLAILRRADQFRTPTNRVCFLLASGYFRATKRFYAPRTFRPRDIEYVSRDLGLEPRDVRPRRYDRQTMLRHQRRILVANGFRPFGTEARRFLQGEIESMVRSQLKPQLIFYRAVDLLIREKIAAPGYHRLSQLILRALGTHKRRLIATVEAHLSPEDRRLLDSLLEKPSADDSGLGHRYRLTLLKRCSQSTRPGKIRESIGDLERLHLLHARLLPTLEALALPHDAIRYYAHGVIRSDVFQVARRTEEDRYLHLIAFIAHQYRRLQDTLVDVLLAALQSSVNAAQRDHKEACYDRREQRGEALKSLSASLQDALAFTASVKRITEDGGLTDAEKVRQIRGLLEASADRRAAIASLKEQVEADLRDTDYHAILEARSTRMQNRVSPILKALSWSGEPGAEPLLEAIDDFKRKDGAIDRNAPTGFLTAAERATVLDGKFRVSLYKALLFLHVMGAIKSGTLNLEHSYKYRSLDDYLISRERWKQGREVLLERAGLAEFADPRVILASLDTQLFEQYQRTNRHLHAGENPHASVTAGGSLRLRTPKLDDQETPPVPRLFPEKHYIALSEVLATVDRHSDFLAGFRHWRQRYHRPRPAKRTFFAGIAALGCDIGTGKILRISREINAAELENTVNWYFYPEGLHEVNDTLLRFMDRLELPQVYRRSPDRLHTSSDGQKFEVRADSLNANYSFKYFGKGKGVSVYSFIDERHLLFYSTVISAAERESAYVIDGLMHNDVVQSDIHSTDTHGYTEAIFGAMHLLGFSYAPRIKGLKRQRLSIFKGRKDAGQTDWAVRPSGYIDTELIEGQWDEILRFIATIRLKEATASDLFRRLNSYSKQHALYRALKAFGKVLKSIFLLRYIDDVELRQAIEGQLNKVESAHRFSRAISIGNGRELDQAEKPDQEVAEGCKRLIKNAIVCWNYLYLTQKIAEAPDADTRTALLESVTAGSAVSWHHINLLGEYDFSDEKLRDSVGIRSPQSLALGAP